MQVYFYLNKFYLQFPGKSCIFNGCFHCFIYPLYHLYFLWLFIINSNFTNAPVQLIIIQNYPEC
jgi:hypothetical protein